VSARAVIAIAAAVLLTGCGDGGARSTSQPHATVFGRPIGPPKPAERGDLEVRAAARTFFTTYLAISYGRAKPGTLRGATAALREQLRVQGARVPPAIKDRRPRLAALRVEPVGGGLARATATIDDGDVAPYPLFATLRRVAGRWLVVSVGG
jgi:hypothetical protein